MTTLKDRVREFLEAFGSRDVEATLSFFADDATWITPAGTFHGTAELRRYVEAETEMVPWVNITEAGMGIVGEGDRVAIEHEIEGPVQGKTCKWLAICSYEFEDDKIKRLNTVYDRLSILQDAADGWLQETLVNAMVKQAEKGLHD